jgi:hypothetical protein
MTTRLIKLACATALAVPFVGFVSTGSAHAWDCDQPYGAIQGGGRHDATCDEVGTHLRFDRHRHHHHHHGGDFGGGPADIAR